MDSIAKATPPMFYNMAMATNSLKSTKPASSAGVSADIGVVIATYNRRTVWQRAIASVIGQEKQAEQIVIVDDGSTDGTAENVREWLKNNPDQRDSVTIVQQEHKGAAAARNTGLKHLNTCDFVLFLDSDDELPPDFLVQACAELQKPANSKAVAISAARFTRFDERGVCDDMMDFAAAPLTWMLYYGGSILSCSLFRHSAVPQDGFDETIELGEDMIFATQIALAGKWLVLNGSCVKFWRGSKDTQGEQKPLTREKDPQKDLGAVLQSIKARKLAVDLHDAKERDKQISQSYWNYILSSWYWLAAQKQQGLSKYSNQYARLAYWHKLLSLGNRLIGN